MLTIDRAPPVSGGEASSLAGRDIRFALLAALVHTFAVRAMKIEHVLCHRLTLRFQAAAAASSLSKQ
jgi:hypothetical protein